MPWCTLFLPGVDPPFFPTSPSPRRRLQALIRFGGPLSVAEFMTHALTHPTDGAPLHTRVYFLSVAASKYSRIFELSAYALH